MGNIPEYSITANYTEDAEDLFVDAKEKLLDVNNWKRYSGLAGADFRLADGHSRLVNRKAHKGDHIKIRVANAAGDVAHCCARIEAIEYDDYPDLAMESFTLRLHRCEDAHGIEEEDGDHGHEAMLVVERRGRNVFAGFHIREERPAGGQDSDTQWLGLSGMQWNSLVKGFVD